MIKDFINEVNSEKKEWYVFPDGYIGAPFYSGQGYIRFIKKVSRFLREHYKDDEDAKRFVELASNNPTDCDIGVLDEMVGCLEVLDDEKETNIQEKRKLNLIGEGSYANVYSYKDKLSNNKLALKKLKENVEEKEMTRFKKEYEYMKGLHHPNILEVYKFSVPLNCHAMKV